MNEANQIMKEYIAAERTLGKAEEAHRGIVLSLTLKMIRNGPIKIGDIVKVTGVSHEGKSMIVDDLWIQKHWLHETYGIQASGRVLKMNGTPGLNEAEHFVEVGAAP